MKKKVPVGPLAHPAGGQETPFHLRVAFGAQPQDTFSDFLKRFSRTLKFTLYPLKYVR